MTGGTDWKRGFLFLIDKPSGLTSHDVVERVRKATRLSRIGHSGTLDPMATGLLLLCAGGAARLQSFFTRLDKSYEGVIRLGRSTTTYDRLWAAFEHLVSVRKDAEASRNSVGSGSGTGIPLPHEEREMT